MQLQKLNADSSWLWEIQGVRILVDPWLEGPQIDVASWFNRQFHQAPCISYEELGEIDLILISHPFTDHCHKATLLKIDPTIPLLASKAAFQKIKDWNHFKTIHLLGDSFPYKGLELQLLKSSKLIDPVHNSILVKNEKHQGLIFYAPHGFTIPKKDSEQLSDFQVLISTASTYNLPFFLGGTVNLGLQSVYQLAQKLKSKHFFLTHDEKKEAFGLVKQLAKTEYPSLEAIEAAMKPCKVYDLESGEKKELLLQPT